MRAISALIALFVLTSGVSAETVKLTREKSVQIALEQNETFKSAQMEKDRVRGQYIEARAGALPQINAEGSYLRNIDKQVSVLTMTQEDGTTEKMQLKFGEPHNYSFGLSLYQPLYAAGKVGAAIKIAKYGFAYTDERIRAAKHDVATEADRAYLSAVAAREAAMVFGEAERLADSNLAVVEKLYKEGQVSEYDYLRAQVQAANVRPNRIAADNNAQLAIDHLRNILALPPDTRIELEPTIQPVAVPKLDLNTLIDEALEKRPELRQSEQSVKIYDKLISIEKSGYKPSVGINSRIQWDSFYPKFSQTRVFDNWNRSWNVSVVLNWPIFSGFATSGRVQQAKVDYNQSRLMDSQLNRQVRLEVQDAFGKVNEARQRVEALGETVAQAERGYAISQVRYQNGIGTQLELQDSQVALTQAKVNRISALHDLAIAVSSLRRAVGREWDVKW